MQRRGLQRAPSRFVIPVWFDNREAPSSFLTSYGQFTRVCAHLEVHGSLSKLTDRIEVFFSSNLFCCGCPIRSQTEEGEKLARSEFIYYFAVDCPCVYVRGMMHDVYTLIVRSREELFS